MPLLYALTVWINEADVKTAVEKDAADILQDTVLQSDGSA